ncbi:MAG TPA: response regulator transcription factor [Acidimicrobiales bacterium]|nr:response regulator transcription factor [Acidimicrobiales bacterium]
MAAPGAPRVVVVEDDASLATALNVGLRGAGYEVVVATDGAGFDDLVRRFQPDLALLDISLPGDQDGFALARGLRAGSDAPLVFITASDSLNDRLAGFEAGADDYVVKPFALAELLARVRAVLRRAGRLHSPVLQVRDIVIDEERRTVRRGGAPLSVTPTEFDLLATLARSPGEVFSKARLLTLVWGFDELDPNLVEVHMSSLRRKLDNDATLLIQTERGQGYVLRP